MQGIIGLAIFVIAWLVVAVQMSNHGVALFRRHVLGFCAGVIAMIVYVVVIAGPATPPPEQREAATETGRPAAIPSSAAEWDTIQKFVQSVWAIGTQQGEAQKKLQATTQALANKLDLPGIRKAQLRYVAQLDKALAALKKINVPDIVDKDGATFASKAYESINDQLLMERNQTITIINAITNPDTMPSQEELVEMTADINRKTAMIVVSLHRLYWNYGYQDKDWDEKTFILKKGVKPVSTVSFNRGDS